jgi:hypothetical protein
MTLPVASSLFALSLQLPSAFVSFISPRGGVRNGIPAAVVAVG